MPREAGRAILARVANGVVYVGSDERQRVCAERQHRRQAVELFTGDLYAIPRPQWRMGWFMSALRWRETVYALNASTGAKLWSYNAGSACSVLARRCGWGGLRHILAELLEESIYAFALGQRRSLPADMTHYDDGPSGRFDHLRLPGMEPGASNADQEVLNTQVPAGQPSTTSASPARRGWARARIRPTWEPGHIVCHENSVMAPNTTWTVRLTVKVTAPAGTVITENAATMADTPDPNLANNTATVSLTVVP